MPPRTGGRHYDIAGLIKKLEEIHKELGDEKDEKEKNEDDTDEFTRLKKMSAKQMTEIRRMITERDELLSSSGGGGKAAVQMSSRIRELIRNAHDLHGKMQEKLSKEEKEVAKGKKNGKLTPEDLEIHQQMAELVSKHIAECESLEKKRYQGRAGGRNGTKGAGVNGEIKRTAMDTDLAPIDLDPDVNEGLIQLRRNDEKLDEQLDMISKGMVRLKGIAVDQSNEVKLQSVMIDQISDNMDKATEHLNDVNMKLKDTLARAGGATNILVKVILLILLLSIGAYMYKAFG
mmetsp:Transcript_46322/g.145332  ORF Transcript_46322/g.145332 Transcript_46322/m.145332 type:complete len:289 (-) Transcript_46322:143-1009(-)